ncbi:PREDICTED: uncharacterized protein LOC109331508 [Lupinus angustifolius]|uniref:uncharacterized protein LOC109331508 n=1 Tax=Lupinus angustifolius TaxID=3871 RepID=UPI00092F0E42|nr:PREDICTED: uncharacterized protein LOC109331508 [Lupinus angustifolius]
MDGGGNRAEAERWLFTANKLLSARDLHGARSFAIRARESDPTFDASELLVTVIDTVLAGETRINDHHRDWYGILQVLRYTTNIDHIAAQYRRLALLLDPHRNPFALSSHAFSLVHDAWSVLSDSVKKAMYDNDLQLLTSQTPPPQQPQPTPPPPQQRQPPPPPLQPQPQQKKNPRSKNVLAGPGRNTRSESLTQPKELGWTESEGASFWTSCPYCYVMYEYPKVYEDCTLRCQNCRRGFHAVVIRSPPLNGLDESFCTWGFLPLGFSGDSKDINGVGSNWNPFSPLFPCSLKGNTKKKKDWVYYDDEVATAFINISDPSEDDSDGDWRGGKSRASKRARSSRKNFSDVKRKPVRRPRRSSHGGGARTENAGGGVGNENAGGGGTGSVTVNGIAPAVPDGINASAGTSKRAQPGKRGAVGGPRRRGAGNLGKLDLNVEFSNDAEERQEPSHAGMREGNPTGQADDNIEGIGFFEGLDEFLSSLPILNVVGDDKVKDH